MVTKKNNNDVKVKMAMLTTTGATHWDAPCPRCCCKSKSILLTLSASIVYELVEDARG